MVVKDNEIFIETPNGQMHQYVCIKPTIEYYICSKQTKNKATYLPSENPCPCEPNSLDDTTTADLATQPFEDNQDECTSSEDHRQDQGRSGALDETIFVWWIVRTIQEAFAADPDIPQP